MPRYRKQTRALLIQIAAREFDRVGYPSASLSAMCREAGLTTGALYHYFDSKSELAGAILDEHLNRVHGMSEHVRATTQSPLDRLGHFLAALTALVADDAVVRASTRLAVDRTVARASDVFLPWASLATALVDDAEPSDPPYTVDAEALGVFAASAVIGTWFAMDGTDRPIRDRRVAMMCTALVVGVVRPEARAAAHTAVARAFDS